MVWRGEGWERGKPDWNERKTEGQRERGGGGADREGVKRERGRGKGEK